MRQVRILAALGLLAAATAANAQVSSTWTLTNDYDFRGATQSAKDPAVQASIDYAHESGWYIGAWASNVDFGNEVGHRLRGRPVHGLFGRRRRRARLGRRSRLSTRIPTIPTPITRRSTASSNYGMFSGALFYSNDFVNSGDSAMYASGDVNVPLPQNFSLLAHAGYSFGDFWDGEDGERARTTSTGRSAWATPSATSTWRSSGWTRRSTTATSGSQATMSTTPKAA